MNRQNFCILFQILVFHSHSHHKWMFILHGSAFRWGEHIPSILECCPNEYVVFLSGSMPWTACEYSTVVLADWSLAIMVCVLCLQGKNSKQSWPTNPSTLGGGRRVALRSDSVRQVPKPTFPKSCSGMPETIADSLQVVGTSLAPSHHRRLLHHRMAPYYSCVTNQWRS